MNILIVRETHTELKEGGGKYWQEQSVLSLHIISITHHITDCLVNVCKHFLLLLGWRIFCTFNNRMVTHSNCRPVEIQFPSFSVRVWGNHLACSDAFSFLRPDCPQFPPSRLSSLSSVQTVLNLLRQYCPQYPPYRLSSVSAPGRARGWWRWWMTARDWRPLHTQWSADCWLFH